MTLKSKSSLSLSIAVLLFSHACLISKVTAQSLSGWTMTKKITLNTSAAGANVSGEVKNFPVAIQLTEANFVFSQAKSKGEDLRFTNAAGALLPYEIEFWDATLKRAAVWVKTDVKGNDNAQYLLMFWGNGEAKSESNSKAVFSAQDGWVGGWHLSEVGNSDEGGYKDASPSEANVTGTKFSLANTAACRIGNCPEFNATEKRFIKLNGDKNKLFDVTQKLSFSIWAKATKYTGDYVTMFSKGDDSWRVQMYGNSGWNGGKYVSEMCVEGPGDGNVDICMTHDDQELKPGAWYHLTVVHDYPNVKYYVNSVAKSSNPGGTWVSLATTTVGIGYQSKGGPTRFFDGFLDEPRFLSVAKDANWVKLDFESQKEGSKFLEYGTVTTRIVLGSKLKSGIDKSRRKISRHDLNGKAYQRYGQTRIRPQAIPEAK